MNPARTHARSAVVAAIAASLGCAPSSTPPRSPAAQATPSGNAAVGDGGAEASPWRTAGWILVGAGASASTVALGTGFLMLQEKGERDSNCNDQKVCNAEGFSANTRLRNLAPVNAVAWGATAAGLGLGAYLVLSHPKKARSEGTSTTVGVSPAGSGLGLDLRGTF